MKWRRIRAVFRKELRHIGRDPRSLIMALAVPCLLLLLFGVALSLDVDRIPTLIYDADHGPAAHELVQRFRGSRFFELHGFVNRYDDLERAIDRGEILMGIAISRDYSERIRGAAAADVQVLLDGSDSNTAALALGYAEALLRGYGFELRARAQQRTAGTEPRIPVDLRTRVWYNSTLESRNYVVPGLIAVMLMIIAALLTSLTIAREWEMGTMEQLLSTPLRPAEMVLGKLMAFLLLGAADTVIAVIVGIFVFGVPFRGNLLLLAGSSFVFLCVAFCWGIFLSAATRSQLLAYQLGLVTCFLPSFLLSGFIYAIESMPPAIQILTRVLPARYFVTITKGIFLKGVGLEVLWPEVLLLAATAILVFAAATRKAGRKVA